MIEAGLYTYLTGHAGLAALVGARIYPLQAPQDATYPLVVYQRISGPREQDHDSPTGLVHPRFQFTGWADTYKEARQVAAQLVAALDGHRGAMGSETALGIQVINELDTYDPETLKKGAIVDAVIWHND